MAVDLTHCTLCPRECGADRTQKQGRCGAGMLPRLARQTERCPMTSM